MAKPIACPCDEFTTAVAEGFIDRINGEFFLASLAGVGSLRSLIYGPKITHCPFCGTRLDDQVGLPPQ